MITMTINIMMMMVITALIIMEYQARSSSMFTPVLVFMVTMIMILDNIIDCLYRGGRRHSNMDTRLQPSPHRHHHQY
tara:strand:+ start:150 stop:380 length:231 start_codon:yes stop_codon:yes gene_type:complete